MRPDGLLVRPGVRVRRRKDWGRSMEIERATESELAPVGAFYESVGYAGGVLPSDTVLVVRERGEIVGAVRLCEERECLLLRGMYIDPSRRRSGVGRSLLLATESAMGDRECWCVPFTHLRRFYGLVGFEEVAAADAPSFLVERRAEYVAQGSAVSIMRRPQKATPRRP